MQALLLKFYVLNPLNLNRHYVPSFILTETRARGPKVCASGRGKTLPLITPATVLLSKLCIQVQRRIHIIKSEVAQSRPTLSDPIDCSLPGSSVHGIFPGKSTRVGCHFLLQRHIISVPFNRFAQSEHTHGFQVALVVKNLPASAGYARDTGSNPGVGEDALEKEMTTYSSSLGLPRYLSW